MTDLTADDIEIVVAGLDRIEIKVTSDVKQGEALKKQILEDHEFSEQWDSSVWSKEKLEEIQINKDKAEKYDLLMSANSEVVKNNITLSQYEAQVKSLQNKVDAFNLINDLPNARKNKEIVERVREYKDMLPFELRELLGDEK